MKKHPASIGTRSNGIMCLAAASLIMLLSPLAAAQHTMHTPSVGGIDAETIPADDAVLPESPARLDLHFDQPVRLVKLTLRDPGRDLLDIGFRYDPQPGRMFMQTLPALPPADYYIADWAVVNDQEQVIYGSFHFSFGPDARPPSDHMDDMEEMRHFMTPDYRLQDTEPPRRLEIRP